MVPKTALLAKVWLKIGDPSILGCQKGQSTYLGERERWLEAPITVNKNTEEQRRDEEQLHLFCEICSFFSHPLKTHQFVPKKISHHFFT